MTSNCWRVLGVPSEALASMACSTEPLRTMWSCLGGGIDCKYRKGPRRWPVTWGLRQQKARTPQAAALWAARVVTGQAFNGKPTQLNAEQWSFAKRPDIVVKVVSA